MHVSHPARGPVRRTGIDGKANRACRRRPGVGACAHLPEATCS
jgi:hypothetical protein